METYQTSMTLGDESSQMWSLNKRLEAYLSRVKALEEENELLRAEIHHLRKEPKAPSIRKYHEEIMKLRDALDDGHQKMVEVEMDRDSIYQEIEYVQDLCLQEKQAQEEAKKEMSESKKLLEEEKRAQVWLKQRLVQLEEEMEDIFRVHEEEKAAMEEEISSFSQRLDSFKVAPVAFQPVNVEDYSIRLSQVWQGAVEDYKNEVSVLESGLSEAKENLRKVLDENKQSQLQLQNLDRELMSLRCRKEMLEEALAKQWLDQQEEEGRLQLEIETLEKEKQDLRAQIAQVLEDRQQLMHLKMSLSLEVATYRSLLEAENTRIYSPTADYKLSSPFSEPFLEKTPLRKRQVESTKTPVARDYRLTPTKRQSAQKSEKISHTPSRHLNVKSTSFSSRPSPVTKEFQKVSSVLQSQSLKYTKAPAEKASTTILSSTERTAERRPPTEDVFNTTKVETISHVYSQGSSKTIQDNIVKAERKEEPLDKIVGSIKAETVENGFLLPGEKEILHTYLKTDYSESSFKTVKDHHLMVHDIALEGQQGSLKIDINGQDLQSNDKAQEEDKLNGHQTELDLPSQVIKNVEADLVAETEEVITEVETHQTLLFEKQELVQSLDYQNIETLMKEDVTDHRVLQAISEPYTSDEKTELLAITPTHEQEIGATLVIAERDQPKTLSSDVVSEDEPLAQQEQDFNGQVSFDLEHATGLSGDVKEDTKQWDDKQDTLLVKQDFEITATQQDNSKVETKSEVQEEEVIDQQIINTLKEIINKQLFIDQKVIEEGDITDDNISDSPESFDDALKSLQINELSKELDHSNTKQHTYEVIVSQEIHSLCSEIDNKEEIRTTNEEPQEEFDLKPVQSQSLLEENKDPSDTLVPEQNQLSVIKEEIHSFEKEVVMSGVDDSSQDHDTEQSSERIDKEEFVNLPQGNEQISEDAKDSQELNQEEQKSLELHSEIYTERKTRIICFTEQITEELIVDNNEVIDQLDAAQSQNLYLSKTGLNELQKELERLEFCDKEQETHDVLGADEGTQIGADIVKLTKLESEQGTSQLSDATQDTVQSFENVQDNQDVNLEKQILFEPRDDEQDQSNLRQELNIELSEDNQNLLDDHNTEDQSVEKNQEQLFDLKQDSNVVPEAETVDILQSFQEDQKHFDLAQNEQVNKLGLDQDISPSESKETVLSADDVIEEPQSNEKASLSFNSAEMYVNAIVEEACKLELDSEKTLARIEESVPDDLKDLEPQAEEEDVSSEIDFNTSLKTEDVEQPAEEKYERYLQQDITDAPTMVQEGQQEEHKSGDIFTETNIKGEDIQFNESEQASQELVESVACALLREQVLLENPRPADKVQEPEPSSNAERKNTLQNESEEISQWTENVIIKESWEVLSTAVEDTFSEEHEVDVQVVHKACDPTEEEGSTMADLESERQLPETETEECISESGNIESGDLTPVSKEFKVPASNQEPELDHESISDCYEDVPTHKVEEGKDSRGPEVGKELEGDQQEVDEEAKNILQQEGSDECPCQVTEENFSQGDSKITEPKALEEHVTDSKDSRDPEADQESELEKENTEEYSSQDTKEEISQDDLEIVSKTTAVDTLAENENSKDDLKTELDLEDISDSKISYEQESVKKHAIEDTDEKISQVSFETEEKDTSEENEDSKDSEANQEPELGYESLSSEQAKITYQPESELDLGKGTYEEISEESSEVVPKMVQDVFSEQNEEIEQLTLAESAVDCTEHESHTPEIGMEENKSVAEKDVETVSQESQDSETDQKTELDQEHHSDIQQEIVLQQEEADEYSIKGPEEQTSHDNLETEITKQDTIEDEQDSKMSIDSEGNQRQEFVEEPLFDTETQFPLEQKKVSFSEATEEETSQKTDGAISKTAEEDTTVEYQEDSKDSQDSEAEHGQELVEEVLPNTEQIEETYSNNVAEEVVVQKMEENYSKTAEQVTTVEYQVDSKDSRDSEAEHAQELVEEAHPNTEQTEEAYSNNFAEEVVLQETEENISKTAEQDTTVEHQEDSKDSWDFEPEHGQGFVKEAHPNIEQIEETCSNNFAKEVVLQETEENISKTPEQVITIKHQEEGKDSCDSEAKHGEEHVKEALPSTEPNFTCQQIEETYSSTFKEELVLQEIEKNISKTAEEDITVENQEDSKDSIDPEAVQETKLDQEDVSDSKSSYEQESVEQHASEEIEEKISQVSCKTLGKDTSEANEEDSKETRKSEADQEPELDQESLLSEEAKITYQQESALGSDKGTDEKISEESCEVVSMMVENVLSEKKEEVELLEQTESEVGSMEHESRTPDIKTENTELEAYLNDVEPVSQEPQDSQPDQKPELDQEQLSDLQQETVPQQEDTDDPKEQTSQDSLDIVTKMTGQDTAEEDEQDAKVSMNSEANQGQGLVEEPLFDTEPQFTLEQKNEEVCEATEEEIRHGSDEVISRTEEQDTTVENQGDSKDSQDYEAEHGQEPVEEALPSTEPDFTCQQIEETYSGKFKEEVVLQEADENISKTAEQDTTVEHQEDSNDSWHSEDEHGQKLVEEALPSTEPDFTCHHIEETYSSNFKEEVVLQETDENISKTAEQDTTIEHQEDSKDFWHSEAEHGQKLVEEALPSTEPDFTCQRIEETYSSNFKEEVVLQETDGNISKTAEQDTIKESVEGQQSAENEFGVVEEDKTTRPELEKANQIIGFESAEETPQLIDYEPVSKELKDAELDQGLEVEADSKRNEEDKLYFQVEGEHETDGKSCEVKDLSQGIYAAISLVEEYATSEEKQIEQKEQNEPEQEGFPLISSELENECAEGKSEESVSASDISKNNQCNDPEGTIQETFESSSCPVLSTEGQLDSTVNTYEQETEQASDQCSEAIEIKDGHLKQSGEVKEESEENYEAACNKNEEIVSSQEEREDEQNIPFSLTMIENNLRFVSENDAEVQPEKQELPIDSAKTSEDLVADEKTSESADLQNDVIEHDSLNKEEFILEDKDFTESINTEEKEEVIVSEPSYQDSSSQELDNQIQETQDAEPVTNEEVEEWTIASETKSDPILVEHNIEQKLYDENPTVTLDFKEPTQEHSEIKDVQPPSIPDDEHSKSDESLDSQDISLFSLKSEDFEISKDYQLEQTLPDSTPLPNLDDEFEDLAEDKVVIMSEEAQNVAVSHFVPELKAEVLEDNLESQIDTKLKAEKLKQELSGFPEYPDEPIFDQKQLEDSEVSKEEHENTESDESFNSQEDISISSQKGDILEASAEYQLEVSQPDSTPLSNVTDGPENLAEEWVILEPESTQTCDVEEFQKVDAKQSSLDVDISKTETESVSEIKELSSTVEHLESELVTLSSDIIQEESPNTQPEENVFFSGDDSNLLKKEDIKDDRSELVPKEFPQGLSTKFDNNETEDVITISDHNRDLAQIQSDESNEELKTHPFGTTNDESQIQETLEHTQDDKEVLAKTMETILESNNSVSSEETSPIVTAMSHETRPEDNNSGIEETSPVMESSDEFAKVGLKEVEERRVDEELLTSQPGQEASIPEHTELHTSDEEKETSDSSFDSNSGNEREAAEEQHSSPTENDIYVKSVNGLHGNTIVQATLDLEDLWVNGHSTGEQGKIVISERKTIVKVEEDIIDVHTQDIIDKSVLKFETSEGKGEGLFQSLLEKSEGTLFDDSSEIKDHTDVEYVDSATDESNYTKKTLKPYLSDGDFNNQTEIKPSALAEGLFVETNQQTVATHQEKEDSWSSDE